MNENVPGVIQKLSCLILVTPFESEVQPEINLDSLVSHERIPVTEDGKWAVSH